MATREQLHEEIDALSEPEIPKVRIVIEEDDSGGAGDSSTVQAKQPKRRRRLSFSAIGEGDPPDASERVDEFVARAIDRAHPAS